MEKREYRKIVFILLSSLLLLSNSVFSLPTLSDVTPANGSISSTDRVTFSFTSSENLNSGIITIYEDGVYKTNYTLTNTSLTAWTYTLNSGQDLEDNTNYTWRAYLKNATSNSLYTGYYGFSVSLSTFFPVAQTITDIIPVFDSILNVIVAVVPITITLVIVGGILIFVSMMLNIIYKIINKKLKI